MYCGPFSLLHVHHVFCDHVVHFVKLPSLENMVVDNKSTHLWPICIAGTSPKFTFECWLVLWCAASEQPTKCSIPSRTSHDLHI